MTNALDVESYAERTARRTAAWLLAVTVVIVACIVFWPSAPEQNSQNGLATFLNAAHLRGLPRWISFEFVESMANVVMFIPLGLLAALALRRFNWLVVPAAAIAATGIEMGQLLFLPGRVASLSDVLANTAGGLIGYLLAAPTVRRRIRRQRRALQGRRGAADPPRRPIEQLR